MAGYSPWSCKEPWIAISIHFSSFLPICPLRDSFKCSQWGNLVYPPWGSPALLKHHSRSANLSLKKKTKKPLILFLYLFFYFWLCCVFIAVPAFSSCGKQRLFLSWCAGFSLQWPLLRSTDSRVCRLSSCGPPGLVALWHVRSSWLMDQTYTSCTGRQILHHPATRETLQTSLLAPRCH